MTEQRLNDAMDRLRASMLGAVQRELRSSTQRISRSPSDVLALWRADRESREAAFNAWLDEAAPQVAAELTAELIPADLRAAGVRFEWAEER